MTLAKAQRLKGNLCCRGSEEGRKKKMRRDEHEAFISHPPDPI